MASNSATILDGDGQSSDWVEIYNPASTAIDLAGWSLTDNASNLAKWTFPSTVVSPGEHLIVFASNAATPDYVDPLGYRHATFALSAGGEYLGLSDPLGVVVSEFAPEYPAQSADVSYGLDHANLGVYFGNPTPGAANDLASVISRGIVISEVMYHPSSELATEEYVEIFNGEATPLDLTGWSLAGGVDFAFPAMTLAPGGYLAVAANMAAFAAKYPGVANSVGGWTGQLSNRGETIQLLDAAGGAVDVVSYFDEGDWADREEGPLDHSHRGWIWSDAHDGGGSSLELVGAAMSNSFGQNWAASTVVDGTPGAANSVADADNDVAPLVIDITHTPAIPRSTEPVAIAARLLDELSVGTSATLYWRVDGAASFTAASMADDGSGADAVAGDNVFTALLPAMADGTIVEFYVESMDSSGNTRTYPSPARPGNQQATNLLYQVDDSFDPAALPGPGDMPEYRLVMIAAEAAELAAINASSSDRLSHARMNGTFLAATSTGVDVRYQVGIRNRGVSSAGRLPQSYHLDIPRDNAWNGLEAFNLNTQYTQNQLVGLKLFAATGEAAEDAQPVLVRVNGVDLSTAGSPAFGVYIQLESSDAVMASNHYPEDDNGNLYKGVRDSQSRPYADFRDLGPDPADYADYYEKQTNASENDYSDLMELIQVLNDEPDATYFARVQQIVDVDQWLNYFAVMTILSSEETSLGTGVGDDYLMYRGVKDPRFQLIPHDFDTILGLGDTSGSPTTDIYRAADIPAISRFLNHPEVLPAYHEKLRTLLTATFSKSSFDAQLDQLLSGFALPADIASMKAFMDARRDYILELVTTPLTVAAALTTAGGFPRTTQDRVALTGTAPLAGVRSVTAGGLPADYDHQTGSWSVGQSTGEVTDLILSGDVWHYLDAGNVPTTDPGNDWRVDDPGWTQSGPSQLGYGDSQQTEVQYVDTDPGASGTQKNITTYFRKTFSIADASEFTSLNLRLLRDDGAVVYLNGVEVVRSNIETGIAIDSTTRADDVVSGSDEDRFYEFAIDPAELQDGENVIAVEIHQENDGSSDISFDLELSGVIGDPGSTGGVPLAAGVNRINVVAYSGPDGTGQALGSDFIDVWYDDGSTTAVGGTITTAVTWTAANGPYIVSSDLIVEGAGVLTVEPGTTVFFDSGTGLTVRDGGWIVAEGTETQRIRFAHNPLNGTAAWEGIELLDTAQDNRLTYIDMQSGDDSGNALLVDTATVVVDHASWLDVNDQVLDLIHPNIVVSNSVIPSISGDETIHLFGLNQGEQFILEDSVIGFNASGNDVMDLGHDTLTPATIIIRGNTFEGSWDDGIDTDGFPVLIENNTFRNFHLNTSRPTTSNAVSTGHVTVSGQTVSSDLVLRGNTFVDNDHHLLLKDFSFATLEHNTMVDATLSAIHFEEPEGTSVIGPGRGADIDGNLFWGTGLVLEGQTASTELTLTNSLVPSELVALGTGNVTGDPLLVDPYGDDFSVARTSPALGAGPGGSDIGAWQAPRFAPASAANLQVTEIHYHPTAGDKPGGEVGGDSDYFEFIELKNTSEEPIDLTDVAFDDGIDFTFPWLASMEPGEVAVLAKNIDLFRSRYGDAIPVAGEYGGQLSNGGERVRLIDASGGVISEITYDDSAPWPAAADGSGASLEFVRAGDPNDPANWAASTEDGGTPGVASVAAPDADFNGDLIVDGGDFLAWQRGYGTTAPNAAKSDGDADNDADVDQNDLAVWMSQFGSVSTIAAATAPVVESVAAAANRSETVQSEAVMLPIQDLTVRPQLGSTDKGGAPRGRRSAVQATESIQGDQSDAQAPTNPRGESPAPRRALRAAASPKLEGMEVSVDSLGELQSRWRRIWRRVK